ncbi:MAG: hypothetical protein HYY04_14925 [Chloroflexi bacterium]|nr:hypothetical protein [Chloroflexota bacterium]
MLRDIVLEQIDHHETRPVPFTLGYEESVGQRLDAYYGGPEWRQRLIPYVIRIPVVDLMMWEPIDERYSRDVFGGIWRLDQRPYHLETPPLSAPSFDGFAFPRPERFIRPEKMAEARRICEQNRDSFLIASVGWGIWEKCWTLRGFENALMDVVAEPDFFAELVDRLVELYVALVGYVADLPTDAIMFGDDWGHQKGVMLGPERWRRFLKPRWARVYEAVHARGKIAVTHCCGSIAEIMPDIVDIGLDVLESVQPEATGMNPYELKRKYGDKITFWGGLGSQSTIPFGTPEEIRNETQRLRSEMARGGGYILAPAKALQPETPTANAVAVVEAFTSPE